MYANVPLVIPAPRRSPNGHVTVRPPTTDAARRLDVLPPQPQPLVDRRSEAGKIGGLLMQEDVRLVTLTGPGGVGKTRLAIAVAEELRHGFSAGVAFVDLAPLSDPRLVISAIARVLGARAGGGESLPEAVQRTLQGRELLLVLDNIEHLLGAVAEVDTLLAACPYLKVLATSRERLGLRWEHEFPLMPLSLPREDDPLTPASLADVPAIALFVRLAQAVRPGFALTAKNAGAVVEICRRLDGIPLALELAAARVKVLTAEQIAARLDDRFRLLTTGSRTALPRHQTLRGTLDWSHDLLSEPERVLLRRLAVFTGGWTLEAAGDVCGLGDNDLHATSPSAPLLSSEDVLDMLSSLVDKSLVLAEVQDGAARYRMLETIRQYALERLAASEEAEVLRRRHAEHYLALAEEAEPHLQAPGKGPWLERIQLEHDNLRAALDWLTAHDPDLGLQLGVALWLFWDVHGYLTEGRERLTALLVRAERRGQTAARVLRGLGTFARKQGDFDTACRLLEEGLAICRELGDSAGEAHHLNSLALVRQDLGDLDSARVLASESLTILCELGDDRGAANALMNLASILKNSGDVAAAVPLEEESLVLKRRTGDLLGLGLVLNNIGVTAERLGDLEAARARYEESLAIKRQLGDRWGSGYSLLNLGTVALAQGDYDAAAAWYGEALRLASQLGDRFIVAECLHGLGAVAGARGAVADAVRLFAAAEALRDSIRTRIPGHRRAEEDRRIDHVRALLNAETFAALWAEGQSLPFDAAVARALAVRESSESSEQPAPQSGDNGPLSTREREVAALLAQGLTNRQVADELVVATSTVDRHVVNILRKLNLSGRAQVAVWAVEHGLTTASS